MPHKRENKNKVISVSTVGMRWVEIKSLFENKVNLSTVKCIPKEDTIMLET